MPTGMEQLEQFVKESIEEWLQELSPEERLKGLPAEELVKRLSPEQMLAALSPEARAELVKLVKSDAGSLPTTPPGEADGNQ
jgi:hypothetical protein